MQHLLQGVTTLPTRVRVEETLYPWLATLLGEGHSEFKPLYAGKLLLLRELDVPALHSLVFLSYT